MFLRRGYIDGYNAHGKLTVYWKTSPVCFYAPLNGVRLRLRGFRRGAGSRLLLWRIARWTEHLWRNALVTSVRLTNERMAYISVRITAAIAVHRTRTGTVDKIKIRHSRTVGVEFERGGRESVTDVDW